MALHVDSVLFITDLPLNCIRECSASGDVGESVAYWRKELAFSVDRAAAITCLRGYGAWEQAELDEMDDDSIAEKILWLACGDFHDYIVEFERKFPGKNPMIGTEKHFDPSSGSDIFCLE